KTEGAGLAQGGRADFPSHVCARNRGSFLWLADTAIYGLSMAGGDQPAGRGDHRVRSIHARLAARRLPANLHGHRWGGMRAPTSTGKTVVVAGVRAYCGARGIFLCHGAMVQSETGC